MKKMFLNSSKFPSVLCWVLLMSCKTL
jgi:hypothetical protein